MNIMFLSIGWPAGIYKDLMDEFVNNNHKVTVVTCREKRYGGSTNLEIDEGIRVLHVKTGNLIATPFIEKGISNLLLGRQFKNAIKKYFGDEHFDLIIMSTPPITLSGVFKHLKNKYNAKTYLLLKDIWPDGIADLGIIRRNGLIYKYFAWQEKRLYDSCDYIGCMSPANIKYVTEHNNPNAIVEENPNSIKIRKKQVIKNRTILEKYGIPKDRTIFLFGGNLGIPQGIDELMNAIAVSDASHAFFVIIGSGTKTTDVKAFAAKYPNKLMYINRLPQEEYETLCESVDVALISLDKRYKIPNFPSRLLSYCENRLPILCYTDSNTDIGDIVEENSCGFKVIQGDRQAFNIAVNKLTASSKLRKKMGENAFKLLEERYTVERSYKIIMQHFE